MENRDPDQILANIKSSPAILAVEAELLMRALNSLAGTGLNALEFVAANQGLSTVQLAMRLKGGCNAVGLTIAIFREAERRGLVRPTAKSLLIGKILAEFPDGWSSVGGIHPAVKLGWSALVKRHASDPQVGEYASQISKELTVNSPPPEGWKPALENDPLIDSLFDRFWPIGEVPREPPTLMTPEQLAHQPWAAWFDHKSLLMEKSLGKEHNKVTHALLPYSMGGALDLYYYPHGLPGTAIATKELSARPNEGPSNDVYRSYELVMFTKHPLTLDEAKDETTNFGRVHAAITAILNEIGPYSVQAKLNPNATGEVAADIERFGGGCVIFDGFACHSDDVVDRFGLLAVIRIFRSEMECARRWSGTSLLIDLLKGKGHYPYSDLDRDPVI